LEERHPPKKFGIFYDSFPASAMNSRGALVILRVCDFREPLQMAKIIL
jgi:hypothetical protein